jgi:hypothetical protein
MSRLKSLSDNPSVTVKSLFTWQKLEFCSSVADWNRGAFRPFPDMFRFTAIFLLAFVLPLCAGPYDEFITTAVHLVRPENTGRFSVRMAALRITGQNSISPSLISNVSSSLAAALKTSPGVTVIKDKTDRSRTNIRGLEQIRQNTRVKPSSAVIEPEYDAGSDELKGLVRDDTGRVFVLPPVRISKVLTTVSIGPLVSASNVLFRYEAPAAKTVGLSGSFNAWDPSGVPMVRGENGQWSLVQQCPPGKIQYVFVVDGVVQPDPGNPDYTDDGFGGRRSVLFVKYAQSRTYGAKK